LTLTGWGQREDALDALVPHGSVITHFPYYRFPTREDALRELAKMPPQDIVIGWSLGGRLGALAITRRIVATKLFVQMSSSFRFVLGAGFYRRYSGDPSSARDSFARIMLEGDSHIGELRQVLQQDDAHDADWLRWIENAQFGMDDADFAEMPRTIIIHGKNDALVSMEQATLYHSRMPRARLEVLSECGHTPHLHAPDRIAAIIREEWELLAR
jgi:pimeloyl-ACP methyl ester carboxylesterase